jgi:glutamate-1-semialdehyde 2,1-aminomutase
MNQDLFAQALRYIPGGVNSPVRSFDSVGGTPFFTSRAAACFLYDQHGKRYIDYVCSWGANIVGHAHPQVIKQVSASLSRGFSYGTPTELEVELAREICQLVPAIERVRLVNSGTEAVMAAIRVARGYTNKDYIIKFNGCYHGHSDGLLVKAGSGLQTLGQPSSAGIPSQTVRHTLICEYNDIVMLQEAFATYPIAAVVIEPYAGNMNLVRPSLEFISAVRALATKHNAVLIFDEVMTGFRVALGGAQALLGVTPDLTTLGKVVGGGMPLAAFGGRKDIMECLAPGGQVYQAGTLSGNPIAVTAGLANLKLIKEPFFYDKLNSFNAELISGLISQASVYGIPFSADFVGGMFGLYFRETPPTNFFEVKQCNGELFKQFFHQMLHLGIFWAPSMFEAGFISAMHSHDALEFTLECASQVFKTLNVKGRHN